MNSSQKSVRRHYIERYSPEIVERACRKANWHKTRAQKLKRTAHFSAWEWLDFCAERLWQCAYCHEKVALEPHHRVELHKGGANSIDNIEALCQDCHRALHEWPDDVSQAWMDFQNQLLRQFEVVVEEMTQVRLGHGTGEENRTRRRGLLLELFPARRGAAPLRGILPRQLAQEPFVALHAFNRDWWNGRAQARVRWIFPGDWEEIVMLSHLVATREKIEMFAPLQLPLMPPPRRNRRANSGQNRRQMAQMAFDFSP